MKVYFINGINAGGSAELYKPEISIGRETDNDISILTAGVSRYHARFICGSDGRWTVIDQKSTNGVRVNSDTVDGSRLLEEGDILTLGDQTIRFGEKKDMKAEIASAFAPETIPVIQPSQTRSDENLVPKVVFEPFALTENEPETPRIEFHESKPETGEHAIESFKTVLTQAGNEPETPKVKFQEFKPEDNKLDTNEPIFKSKEEPPSEKTLTSAMVFSYIEDKTEVAKHLSEALLKGKANIFASKEQLKAEMAGDDPNKPRRRFSNLLFYTIVICSAVVFVALFIMFQENQKGRSEVKVEKKVVSSPLLVYYEKDKATPDNLFRFTMRLEAGKAYFNIDDLKSQRHYSKTIDKVNPALLETLKKEIEGTTFLSLQQQPAESAQDNMNETRHLVVSYDDKINNITVKNSYAPGAFETIERAINDFAGNFGLQTIALSPDELKQRAEELYQKAEDLFQNREAKPEKLLDAISRYQMAVEYLDQFSPKPATWDKARKRASEAESILNKMREDLKFEYQRLAQLSEYENAKAVSAQLMNLYPQGSKEYETFKSKNRQWDKMIKERTRR
ncbi:MAG: FHA domain-containing protein [Victivallaceae bacterium]|jgi:pSer/pThr/pTyr-binding forkhead associated (FHA) protein